MHKVPYVLEKSAFSTFLIFYFISCEEGRRTQPSSIHLNSQSYYSDTRWFSLYDLYFLKNSLTSAFKRLATKKDLGPFKIGAVVDSNRSVNLPFDIRKVPLVCIYPRKRKDIRGLQMFQIGDLSSFLAGGLTCIRRGDLFVSWSGCREDQNP